MMKLLVLELCLFVPHNEYRWKCLDFWICALFLMTNVGFLLVPQTKFLFFILIFSCQKHKEKCKQFITNSIFTISNFFEQNNVS